MQKVTIVTQHPGCSALPWLRFLLGDLAGDVIEDPEAHVLLPDSVVVCDRPDQLKSKFLTAIRRLGTVGLFHVSDRRYRCRLDSYASFGFVWRTYYHSGLAGMSVRQLPLGPAVLAEISTEAMPAALRSPAERLYTWSFAGHVSDAHSDMLDAFSPIEGGLWSDKPIFEPTDLEVLADSVFAPCPADGHLESARIYEALEVGTIPVVERRRRLDYFHELLGDHPLPTVRSWPEGAELVSGLLADQSALVALHHRVVSWWTAAKADLAAMLQEDVELCLSTMLSGAERNGTPLNRPAPRWRGRVEMLRHRPPGDLAQLTHLKRREKRRS